VGWVPSSACQVRRRRRSGLAGGRQLLTVEIALPESKSSRSSSPTERRRVPHLRRDRHGLDDVELTKEQVRGLSTPISSTTTSSSSKASRQDAAHEQPQRRKQAPTRAEARPHVEPSLDSLRLYLREIGKVPLLTPTGRSACKTDRARRLAQKTQMNEANLRLVVSIAKGYLGRASASSISFRREASVYPRGEKFDYRKGYKSSTYATWWIRQPHAASPTRAHDPHSGAHGREAEKVVHIERQLVSDSAVTDRTRSRELENERRTRCARSSPWRSSWSPREADGEEEDSSLGDFVQDETAESTVRHRQLSSARDIEMASGRCPMRERQVICPPLRFARRPPQTLEELAEPLASRVSASADREQHPEELEHLPEAQALRNAVRLATRRSRVSAGPRRAPRDEQLAMRALNRGIGRPIPR